MMQKQYEPEFIDWAEIVWRVILIIDRQAPGRQHKKHTTAAHAYLDPGIGSVIIQIIIGGIAACVSTLRCYGQKVTAFLGAEKSVFRRLIRLFRAAETLVGL